MSDFEQLVSHETLPPFLNISRSAEIQQHSVVFEGQV